MTVTDTDKAFRGYVTCIIVISKLALSLALLYIHYFGELRMCLFVDSIGHKFKTSTHVTRESSPLILCDIPLVRPLNVAHSRNEE